MDVIDVPDMTPTEERELRRVFDFLSNYDEKRSLRDSLEAHLKDKDDSEGKIAYSRSHAEREILSRKIRELEGMIENLENEISFLFFILNC